MAQEEQEEGLLGFNWEGDGEDFFGTNEEAVATLPAKKEEPKKKEEESEEEEEEIKNDSFFDEEETEEDGKTTSTTSTSNDNFYTDVYKDLKEQGIFKHVELEEGEELDSEKLIELQEQEYSAEVSARLQTWAKEELDADAQAFIKFKRDGGNTEDFFETYSKTTDIPTGDLKDESYQDKVIRYQLKEEGWDADEVEDRLKYLTESGRKEKVAKKYDDKVKQDADKDKQETLKKAEATKQQSLEQEQNFKDSVKTVLADTDNVNGVKITQKDKTQLYNFLTKKTHKIAGSRSITGFQKKLGEAFQDTSKMVLLAKLVNSDFDMKEFEKATVTKKTKQIKSNLEQRKNLRPTNSGSSLEGSNLADLFN